MVTDAHAGMSRLHVASGVGAGSAGAGANLLAQQTLEARYVGVGEEAVDAFVGRDIGDEIVHHSVDRGLSAKPLVQRWCGGVGWRRLGEAGGQCQDARDGQQTMKANGSKHDDILLGLGRVGLW